MEDSLIRGELEDQSSMENILAITAMEYRGLLIRITIKYQCPNLYQLKDFRGDHLEGVQKVTNPKKIMVS